MSDYFKYMQYPKKQYICLDCMRKFPIDRKLCSLIKAILGKKREIKCPRCKGIKGKTIMLYRINKYKCMNCHNYFSIKRKLLDNLLWLFLGKNKEVECPICKSKEIKKSPYDLGIKSLTYKKYK